MKKYLLINLFAFACITASAQNVKLKEIQEVKAGKLIVALSGNDTIDTYFKNAIDRYWTYKEITEYLPFSEAMKKAKKDKETFVLYLGKGSSTSPSKNSYKTISTSRRVKITSGKNYAVPEVFAYYPTYSDRHITQEALYFGVAAIEHICQTMETDNIKSALKWNAVFNKYNSELASKMVYINESWIDGELTETDIQEIYPFPIKVVSSEVWSDAILNQERDIVYVIIVPIPAAGSYTFVHYFMSATDAKIMGTAYSKVNPQVQGINVARANSKYIRKKNIKMYAKMVD